MDGAHATESECTGRRDRGGEEDYLGDLTLTLTLILIEVDEEDYVGELEGAKGRGRSQEGNQRGSDMRWDRSIMAQAQYG